MSEPFQEVQFAAMSGAGNTFAVVLASGLPFRDSTADPGEDEPGESFRSYLARELCAQGPGQGKGFDGVLLVGTPFETEADVSMQVWNADGTRAKACGNGLRVVAKYFADRLDSRQTTVHIATDSGLAAVEVEREGGRVVRATATLGRARPFAGGVVRHAGRELAPDWIEIGNRHAVLFTPEVRLEELHELGPVVERSCEGGVNVELVEPPANPGDPFRARVWERGVGETAACGSGACAVAAAARARGLADDTVDLDFPGGRLRVTWSEPDGYRLTGDCEELGTGTILLAQEPGARETKGAS